VTNDALFESWKGLSDAEFATVLAQHVGTLLVQHREQLIDRGNVSVWQLKDSGDLLAHHFLMDAFRAVRPGDSVLSEEGHDDRTRVHADRVWIVDPLDGVAWSSTVVGDPMEKAALQSVGWSFGKGLRGSNPSAPSVLPS
jgi:hypothetical protein